MEQIGVLDLQIQDKRLQLQSGLTHEWVKKFQQFEADEPLVGDQCVKWKTFKLGEK